jgi:hypothetical protein
MANPTITTSRPMAPMVSAKNMLSYDQMDKRWVRQEFTSHSVPIYHARNETAERFLSQTVKDKFVLFLDDDMIYPSNLATRLASLDLPLVGGLYFQKDAPYEPQMFREKSKLLVPNKLYGETGHYNLVANWEPNTVVRVDGIGAGAMMIRRDVLEAVKRLDMPMFSFAEGTEDLFFCRLVQQVGFPIHCDTSMLCQHLNHLPISVAHYHMWQRAQKDGLVVGSTPKVFIAERTDIIDANLERPPFENMVRTKKPWARESAVPSHPTRDGVPVLESNITVGRPLREMVAAKHIGNYYGLYKRGIRHEIKTIDVPVWEGRNLIVEAFLDQTKKDDFLLLLDDKLLYPAEFAIRLASHNLPVVSGVYVDEHPPFRMNFAPQEVFVKALPEVKAVGAGALMVRRDVLEKIKPPWFGECWDGGEVLDAKFSKKVRDAGFQINVDTSQECSRITSQQMGIEHYRSWREARDAGVQEPKKDRTIWVGFRENWVNEQAVAAK